ncbi:MAG: HlyD family efflux transporter periplasmic adaptor subunit [Erysipelotrichia bacterium]|nr:HlyD family efflux transporter periplasmic adaptor subunit [Erysipelotrichia bacterium]
MRRMKMFLLIALSAALLAGAGILVKNSLTSKTEVSKEGSEEIRTVILTKGDLKQSIVVKGTVKSEESSSVSSPMEARIRTLNVKIGDMVKKGDIIAELDDSSMKGDVEKKQKDIAKQKSDYKDAFDKLTKQQEASGASKNRVAEEQNRLVSQAEKDYQNAVSAKNNYESTYQRAVSEYNQAVSETKARTEETAQKDQLMQQAYLAWSQVDLKDPSPEMDAYKAAKAELDAAQARLREAQTVFNVSEKEKNYSDASGKYNALTSEIATAKSKQEEAVRAKDEAIRSAENAIAELNQQAAQAWKTYQDYTGKDELAEVEKLKQSYILKAESSGKITELNAKIGSVAKGEVAVIQSVDKLVMEVQVDASDINKVKEGMNADITTDTSGDVVKGTVRRISPTASATEGKEGFTVVITIGDANKVFVGTKATAEIIVSSISNVFSVPLDAIFEDGSGSHILVRQTDGIFKDVLVKVGSVNEYNAEISGTEVTEGAEVQAVFDWQTLKSNQKDPMEG